ncbi:SNF5-domain-containing protein [Mycena vulgaris]|nr:SNF5-domain-containing protein [Mycena vulgaris]
MRSSSASGSEVNGYGRPLSSNGRGTPQPQQRQPSFGPQAQTPQRHPSLPRSVSPVKPVPPTPVRTEPVVAATPSAAPPPPPAVPAASAAPLPALIPALPPLPASVNLNPSVTRVTIVPLATSLTTIPPVTPDEVASVKEWMDKDRAYETVFREMKTRMGGEYRELMGPRNIPWWEKGTLDVNASRFAHGRDKFEVRYPYRRRERDGGHRKGARREGLKLPRKLDPEDANRPEELVPIRLEFDIEHHKIRDTFVWDMNACVVSPEHFAQTVVEDYNLAPMYHAVIVKAIQDQLSDYRAHSANYDGDSWDVAVTNDTLRAGTLEGESAAWWCKWRKRLRTEYVRGERGTGHKRRKVVKDEPENERPMSIEEFTINDKALHEDMRILVRLDIIVGSMKLDDQFEWDLDNEAASPEDFAQIYTQELGLGGEFRTAIAHSIREQVHAYQKSLFLVGHTMDGAPVQDEDLRNSFLPSLSSGARSIEQVQAFTPLLNYLSDGELERHEKERDKDYNKRRKRNRGGRRGVALPDREPIRTYRTPAIGFPEPDPATLAAAAAAAAPMSRRAAAAAASLTIANLVASENGGPTYTPSSLPAVPAPPPLILKEKTTKGFFKPPPYDTAVLRARARIPAPIPSTAADVSKLPAPLENDPPPPPPTAIVVPDHRAPRAVTAKRAKELEREAKEKEFAEGQQQNMINGVWHCSNCGCPDSIAVGRRKGPLGDKSQCGTCGKYWHRYRKPRPVEYNSDYEFHATGLKKEADLAKRRRGRPQSGTVPATPADTSAPQTPRDSGEEPSRQSPVRDVSPVSTASSASEPPLAQIIKEQTIKNSRTPSTPPPPSAAPVAVPTPTQSPVVVPASIPSPPPPPPPVSVDVAAPPPSAAPPTSQSSAPVSAPRPVPTSPPNPIQVLDRPEWLLNAMQAMQADYKNDKFDIIPKPSANGPDWRIRCLDCPGKLYITGPGETLSNYELHLKNRLHRQRVSDRMANSSLS